MCPGESTRWFRPQSFLFQIGIELLEPIDDVPARVERFGPMRSAHGDRHRDVADIEPAEPMDHRDLADRPATADIVLDLAHLLLGHAGIGFVLEGGGHRSAGEVANRAEKRDDGPARASAHRIEDVVEIDDVSRQRTMWEL